MTTSEFVSSLMAARIDMHIAHLQTKKYSQHMALDGFYNDIVGLTDTFVESYQGMYSLIKGYKIEFSEGVDPVKYLQNLMSEYTVHRTTYTDGFLQQIIDDIIQLIAQTVYKLKYLTA